MPTQEEYVTQCMTTGKTKEDCEELWRKSQETPSTDKDFSELRREVEMQKVEIKQLKDALKEATNIITSVNAERNAVTDARKYELALQLEKDSDGNLKHGDLMLKDLNELTIMKTAIDVARPKNFVSISQMIGRDSQKQKKPQLTVGQYNPDTKQYEGGI